MLSVCWQAERGLSFFRATQMPMNRAFFETRPSFQLPYKNMISPEFSGVSYIKIWQSPKNGTPHFHQKTFAYKVFGAPQIFYFCFHAALPTGFADSHYGL